MQNKLIHQRGKLLINFSKVLHQCYLKTILLSFLLCCLLLSNLTACKFSAQPAANTVYVYNWGSYIDHTLIHKFEVQSGYKVIYETFNTNEDLYVKLKNSSNRYDVIVPSDYMVERLIKEKLVKKLDYQQLPNAKYIDANFLENDYDPHDNYSIPYFWGTVGILYNPDMVKDKVTSFDILWNKNYAKNIIMLDSSRDNMCIALRKNGFSGNSTNLDELKKAKADLMEQFPLVYAYLVDQAKDIMINEECALAVLYSGDALDAIAENPKLRYFIPPNSNLWTDAMCIPQNATNIKGAHAFINFMLDPENLSQNAEEIGYAVAESAAKELLPDDIKNDKNAYPPLAQLKDLENFRDIGKLQRIYDEYMQEVKNQ